MELNAKRCLYCYKKLSGIEIDFHSKCSKAFFGTAVAPKLSLTNDELNELLKDHVAYQEKSERGETYFSLWKKGQAFHQELGTF